MNEKRQLVNTLVTDIFEDVLSLQEQVLRNHGIPLSISEVHTLEAIAKSKDSNKMTVIAELLNITASTLTINVNRLVKKGYIKKERNIQDKRIIQLVLTDNALEILNIHKRFHQELVDSFFEDLKLNEDEVLLHSLERVVKHLKHIKQKNS